MMGSRAVELLGRAIAQTTWLPPGSISGTESGRMSPQACTLQRSENAGY